MFKIISILSVVVLSLFLGGVGLYAYFTKTSVNCESLTPNVNSAASPVVKPTGEDEVSVPKPTEWVDYGPILEAGPEGAWDFVWTGMASIVKKHDTYYFYYVANDGYRSHDGEAARRRAIGVATSQDGIRFTKYEGNPVMAHAPFNGEEEGANSAGVALGTDGHFVMYYGAAIGPKDTINADGRVAVSQDGYNFRDITMVLDHRPPFARFLPAVLQRPRLYRAVHRWLPTLFYGSVPHGYGDEIFPVATFQHEGNWYVYYVPNGGTAPRTLGVAWGPSVDRLPCSVKALDGSWSEPAAAWGNVVWLAPDKIALFVQRLWRPETVVEVRTASPHAPHQLSEPIERYDIPNLAHGALFLDAERRTWFMYYNTFDHYWRVKLARAGDPDTTPPTAPRNVSARVINHETIEFSWEAAKDPDTGVVQYNIYRNGSRVGRTKDLKFRDSGLSELTRYHYRVTAVNFHGVEGPGQQTAATTHRDRTPPRVVSATSIVNPTQLIVLFNKPVNRLSAQNNANYSINSGLIIKRVSLDTTGRRAILTTSPHTENSKYTLAVREILDRASIPNAMEAEHTISYTYSAIPGLMGSWDFSQRTGTVASDSSGHSNDGIIYGERSRQNGDKTLLFNGKDNYVLIPNSLALQNVTAGSFTFTAWVKPENIPASANGYGIVLRVAGHPAYFFGLSYIPDGKYQAQLITMPKWSFMSLASARIEPKIWHQVTMVVDDVAKQLQLYVDAKPVSGSPKRYSGTLLDLDQAEGQKHMGGDYYIGSTKPDRGAGSFFSRHFKGLIGEARLYNRALNPEEVWRLFELTAPTGRPRLEIGENSTFRTPAHR